MDQKFKVLFGAMCALWCGLCISNEAFGQTLPDGKGKAEFVHNCTACHRADMVVRVKKTPDDWRKSVDEMAARGTDGSKEELEFQNVFGKLKRTQTEKYVPPDELKSNILRGKAGLQVTAGPKLGGRKDELKESLIKQKEAIKIIM